MDDFDDIFVEGAPNYNELDDECEVGDFFRNNLLKVRAAVSEQDFRKFANLEDNGERVAFILKHDEAHDLPVEVESSETKNAENSDNFKKDGNKAFGVQHYEKSIEEYNNAVLVATKERKFVDLVCFWQVLLYWCVFRVDVCITFGILSGQFF